jgi:hypothetical protein
MRNVHGLAINPRDGMLYAATDTGVFRVSERGQATRVSGRDQEVMGFTVFGPDRFLGSGHPDLGGTGSQPSDRPPLLGLVESRDAGRTWRSLALQGEADFHDLTVAHGLVYGYESTFGRLMVSRDRTHWETRSRKTVSSFVVSPDSPQVLVAADEQGPVHSTDGGRRWRRLTGPRLELLEWSRADALWGADRNGQVHLSRDVGRSWHARGRIGGEPGALLADGRVWYAALYDGRIVRSQDSGQTWRDVYRPRAEDE